MNKSPRYFYQLHRSCLHKILRVLYSKVDGKSLSKLGQSENEKEKEETASVFETPEKKDLSLTYGEVKSESFEQLLNLALSFCTLDHGSGSDFCFYDLGGGTGKPVMTAALNPNPVRFSECCSIELIRELSDAAVHVHEEFLSILSNVRNGKAPISIIGNETTTPTIGNKNKNMHLSEIEFLGCAENLISTNNLRNANELANSLVKHLGHKAFKATMKANKIKQFGTFVDKYYLFTQAVPMKTSPHDTETDEISVHDNIESHEKEEGLAIDQSKVENEEEEEVEWNELYDVFSKDKDLLVCFNQRPIIKVTLLEGDIFDNTLRDWTQDAAVVYCASLLFTDRMLTTLLERVMLMRSGSVFMSLRELPISSAEEAKVELRYEAFFQMSWQKANVYVYVIH